MKDLSAKICLISPCAFSIPHLSFSLCRTRTGSLSLSLSLSLPLPVPIDRADPTTWILPLNVAPPLQPQHQHQPGAEPAAQPPIDPFGVPPPEQHNAQHPPYWAPGPGQATSQQMYELMQTMNTNITNLATQSATQYTQLRAYERFTAVDQQIADLRTYIHDQYGEHRTYMSSQFGNFHTEMTQLGTQMGRMQAQYSDLTGDVDEMADQQHGTYHQTDRIYTHMSRSGFVTADSIPRRRRHRRTPSQEDAPPQHYFACIVSFLIPSFSFL